MDKQQHTDDKNKATLNNIKGAMAYYKVTIALSLLLLLISLFIMPSGIILLFISLFGLYFGVKNLNLLKSYSNSDANRNISQEENKNDSEVENVDRKTAIQEIDESQKNYDLFNSVVEDNNSIKHALCYEYEHNICLINYDINNLSGHGGEEIKFMQEPENEFDKKAVAIYLNDDKIGYVYKGQTQDMLNNWGKKDFVVLGYINKINIKDNKATFKIGFYKPLDELESKTFSLIKTKKKIDDDLRREDNLVSCNEGESVSIECGYDYEKGTNICVVYSDIYAEIGELGNGALKFLEEHSNKKSTGIIDEISYDESGSIKAKIKVILL